MTLRGIARGTVIELEQGTGLPEGTVVEVEVKEVTASTPKRISPAELAQFLRSTPGVSQEDADELMRVIKERRRPADYRGIFDEPEA